MTIKQQDHFLFNRRQQSRELHKELLLATYRPDPMKIDSDNYQKTSHKKKTTIKTNKPFSFSQAATVKRTSQRTSVGDVSA
jgi:hypothetical protein